MKKLLVATLSLAFLFTFTSCNYVGKEVQGSGTRKTEKRELAAFKTIETTGAFEIKVTCQQPASFEIEGDDNILPLITTEVRGGVLKIYNEKSYNTAKAIVVRVSVSDLDKVSSTGAANIDIKNVKNERLEISSTGAGNIQAAGETKSADIRSTGAGKIDTGSLHAELARVSVTGAAHVDVYAKQQLDVTVSGVGQVTYDGNPPVVNKSVSGLGAVNKKSGGS